MGTATVVQERVSHFCPTTNFYATSDGRHLLVTVPRVDVARSVEATTGLTIPISVSHLPTHADVFLADADANVLDADGDLANGMTPLVRVHDCDSFEAALSAAGYQLSDVSGE